MTNKINSQKLLEQVNLLWQVGDWQSLIDICRDFTEGECEKPQLALNIAAAYLQIGEVRSAQQWLARSHELGCSKEKQYAVLASGVLNSLGRLSALSNRKDQAEDLINQAFSKRYHETIVPQICKARLNEQLSQLDQAKRKAKTRHVLACGETAFYKKKWDLALKHFQKAISIAPDEALAYQWVGETCSRKKQWHQTVRAYREALKRDPMIGLSFYNKLTIEKPQNDRKIVANPVFVVGCGHSGTSIMISLMGNHPRLYAVPGETDIFRQPDEDVLKSMEAWDKSCWEAGCTTWVEKTPANIFQIGRFLKMRPDARFIIMLRDGRDVVQSLKSRVEFQSIDERIERWIYDNLAGMPYWDHPQTLAVKYEDLIENPKKTLKAICGHIDLEYTDQILDRQSKEKELHWYSEEVEKHSAITNQNDHKNLRNWQINQPIFDGRFKWKKEMSTEDLNKFYSAIKAHSVQINRLIEQYKFF